MGEDCEGSLSLACVGCGVEAAGGAGEQMDESGVWNCVSGNWLVSGFDTEETE